MNQNEKYMKAAIKEAELSGIDLPIGAVIVYNDRIIAKAHNEKEQKQNCTFHAEMLVINQAQKLLKTWRLNECSLYSTLEPCPMCGWAILQAGIKYLCFGASDTLYGAFGGAMNLKETANSKIQVICGICENECSQLLKNYIKTMRNKPL